MPEFMGCVIEGGYSKLLELRFDQFEHAFDKRDFDYQDFRSMPKDK